MATVVENHPDSIIFVNGGRGDKENSPTLSVQAGDWEVEDHVESGVVFDAYGPQPPLLTPADARKLAKWLQRAADSLEGVKHSDKKKSRHNYYEQDDVDDY
jgi:hypothetical protein